MLLCLSILALLLLQTTLSSPLTTPVRGCSTCKDKQSKHQTPASVNATTLTAGEPCGVYTLRCALGLRCAPPEEDPRPLRALIEGRGACTNVSSASPTREAYAEDTASTDNPNEGPCRKRLNTLIKGFDSHLFRSHQDIYIPNCDKHGFYKKKQCWSSRGKQRGRCWCVDEKGTAVPSNSKQRDTLSC